MSMSAAPFCYEQRRLENDLVALEPFDPTLHAANFISQKQTHPELFQYVAFPDVNTEEEFVKDVYKPHIAALPGECLYAIIDKTKPEPATQGYAGTIALSNTSAANASTEFGVLVFPAFQRTHVASNAIGLLLLYTLDPPSMGGLGLRRVEWKCHSGNEASKKAALRMGFELEGVLRWERAFPWPTGVAVDALERRNGTVGEARGRHTAVFSIVWDEWEGKRDGVLVQMERRS
ncbi:GNAT family N-acetyltransferase, partial [Aspergillus lucknowensis]